MQNTRCLDKYERAMYEFAKQYLHTNQLCSLSKDRLTQETAEKLVKRGLIVINEFNQFTLKEGE